MYRLQVGSEVAERDIVQFVPFREFAQVSYTSCLDTVSYWGGGHWDLALEQVSKFSNNIHSKYMYKGLLGMYMFLLAPTFWWNLHKSNISSYFCGV